MATILFYTPFNNRSRDTESLMLIFKAKGHEVISLSQAQGNFIHPFLAANGIKTQSFFLQGSKGLWYHFRHLLYFIWFCWMNKVNIVYSHLESANFVASIGQFFIPSKVYVCRHHEDLFGFQRKKMGLSYLMTYKLARKIIVVSEATRRYMVQKEGIKESKILVIPLAYDFSLYDSINSDFVEQLRNDTSCDIILISVGQFMSIKRPEISIRVLEKLVKDGYNAKLFLLGAGKLEAECKLLTRVLELEDRVIFTGFVQNVLDYLSMADIVLHPSISESSCVVVKEAGYLNKPVIVCKEVGDFDSYIKNGVNGFLVDKENFIDLATSIIIANKNIPMFGLKQSLKSEVVNLFSIENVVSRYEPLNQV